MCSRSRAVPPYHRGARPSFLVHLPVILAIGALAFTNVVPALAKGTRPEPGAKPAPTTTTTTTGALCSTATSTSLSNVNTSCQATRHNETSIAVNPRDSTNLIESSNDYTYQKSSSYTLLTPAHVSTDGGHSWSTYAISHAGYGGTTDPSIAFDASGTAYFSMLGMVNNNPQDVLLSRSTDKGQTWTAPMVLAHGSSSSDGSGVFNDHPQVTGWGTGNIIVTWIRYVNASGGGLVSAPVYDIVSHDSGATWSSPTAISGSASFCRGLTTSTACDQAWGNSAAVSTAGRLLVTFQDTYNYGCCGVTNLGRNNYLSVEVYPSNGAPVSGPSLIGQASDGILEYDYPTTSEPRQTLHDSQFRLLSQGNVTADPTNALHFAVVWYDDRNAPHPVSSDPYSATTNADIIYSQTLDAGSTWSTPAAIARAGDQFMPSAAYDASGYLHIGFFDRSYDPNNLQYGYTIATETARGSLSFGFVKASTAMSDPTQGNRWPIAGATVNPAFPYPATFIGDYSSIAALPAAGAGLPAPVVALWTDLRQQICFDHRCGWGQDSYFAMVPSS